MSANKKAIRQHFNNVCLKRDKHCCRMCGAPDSPFSSFIKDHLDVHHITDRHDLPNGGYVLENGISLCATCHEKAEIFHSTGVACPGYSVEDLYNKIGSSFEKSLAASLKLCK